MKIIENLLKIKSLWSIVAMIIFSILAIKQVLPNEFISAIISSIVTYYFTKKEDTNV